MAATARAEAISVMISVYRIYLGRSWVVSGEAPRLLALFDALPEFLHSAGLLDVGPETAEASAASHRAAVKVAMTHCHVAVLWAGADPVPAWTGHDIAVARTGFRWRVPTLAVRPPGTGVADAAGNAVCAAADRVVGWSGIEIARAVQELAETAAALRRSDIERIAPPAFAAAAPLPRSDRIAETAAVRPLPTVEIIAAYTGLKAARARPGPGGEM